MKVLVTGGSGFVGSHLVRCLIRYDNDVSCLVRPRSRLENLKNLPITLRPGDLTDRASLREAVNGCQIVFHCAADYRLWCPNPESMFQINVEGTNSLMQICSEEGVERVVYTSTVGCLGKYAKGVLADEATPARLEDMLSPYKRTKFLAEETVLDWAERGLPVVIVNPSTPIGEMDIKPTPTGKVIVDFLRGKMFGYVDTGINLIDVLDVAEGHWLAAKKGKPGQKYILGHVNLTLKDFFDQLGRISGLPSPRLPIPYWVAAGYAYAENFWSGKILHQEPSVPVEGVRMSRSKMWFTSAKAIRELGLPQNPVEKAMQRAVDWFRRMGYVDQASPKPILDSI